MEQDNIFGPLLSRPGFRADLLYFTRLAGNYAAQIFIDMRTRADAKHRKAFAEWLKGTAVGREAHLQRNLVEKDPWFDPFKKDFPVLVRAMQPTAMQVRLERALGKDHALPLDLHGFEALLDDLRNYRHWLEHYEERIRKREPKPVTDARLLDRLGLMLLPFLGNHLLGRIHHHGRAARWRGVTDVQACARERIKAAQESRREASKFMNGLKRRTDHDSIKAELGRKRGRDPHDSEVQRIAKQRAKERRDLEDNKEALLKLYRRYFDETTWPRYNYENFLWRFAFIGRGRIKQLEELAILGGPPREADQAPDFIHAIEPLFGLSMDIALIVHVWMTELEAAGVPMNKEKKVGRVVREIRNAVAHGGWIWAVESRPARDAEVRILTFAEVLDALLALPAKVGLHDAAAARNRLVTRIEAALRDASRTFVYDLQSPEDDINRRPPPVVIRRWTAVRRAQFADRDRFRIERRPDLRRVAALWMRDLAGARTGAGRTDEN